MLTRIQVEMAERLARTCGNGWAFSEVALADVEQAILQTARTEGSLRVEEDPRAEGKLITQEIEGLEWVVNKEGSIALAAFDHWGDLMPIVQLQWVREEEGWRPSAEIIWEELKVRKKHLQLIEKAARGVFVGGKAEAEALRVLEKDVVLWERKVAKKMNRQIRSFLGLAEKYAKEYPGDREVLKSIQSAIALSLKDEKKLY